MSLINRMLRDLSTRQPESGNVMKGIQIGGYEPQSPRRLVPLLALVAGLGVAIWYFIPKAPPPAATPPQIAAIPAVAPAPAPPAKLQIDQTLSPAAAAAPAPEAASEAPAAKPEAPAPAEPRVAARTPARAAAKPAPKPAPAKAAAESEATAPTPAAPAPEPAKPRVAEASAAPRATSARDQREAEAHFAEANAALKRGEPASAERELRAALDLDPTLHAARDELLATLIDQGRLDEAQGVLNEGLAQEPQRVAFRRLGARIDLARGQPDLARQRLETSPPAVTADPEYHGLLAAAYQRLERHQDAAREYQALVQAQPAEGHWWAGLGISRDVLGDTTGALGAYSQARQLGHLDPRLLDYVTRRIAALQPAE